MKYRVTTNGGIPLAPPCSLETAQALILAHRQRTTYVRSVGAHETQRGWVFEHFNGVVVFTVFGAIKDDEITNSYCPWMLTLRRAVTEVPATEGTTT